MEEHAANGEQFLLQQLTRLGGPAELIGLVAIERANNHNDQTNIGEHAPGEGCKLRHTGPPDHVSNGVLNASRSEPHRLSHTPQAWTSSPNWEERPGSQPTQRPLICSL